MPDKKKIQPVQPVEKTVLYVLEKKPFEFLNLLCLLDAYVKQKKKVGPVIIEKLLRMFLHGEEDIVDLLFAGIREKARKMLDSLNLHFETTVDSSRLPVQYQGMRQQGKKVIFSFSEFVELFDRWLPRNSEAEALKTLSDKKSFVQLVYTSLYYYLDEVPDKKRPSMYKQTALVGMLAVVCGLLPDEKTFMQTSVSSKYYLEFLSESVRHHCVTAKKRLDKEKKNKVVKVKDPNEEDWDLL